MVDHFNSRPVAQNVTSCQLNRDEGGLPPEAVATHTHPFSNYSLSPAALASMVGHKSEIVCPFSTGLHCAKGTLTGWKDRQNTVTNCV